MKPSSMADVARLAGVSKSTVSAVINNKDIVRETTRRRVLQAIAELNYRPQPTAGTATRSTGTRCIGYLIKEAGNPYYAETLAGIQEVAHEAGYLVFVSSSEGQYSLEQDIVQQFSAHHFDGLIVTPILNDETDLMHIFELKRQHVPFILLENIRGVRASLVDTDNVRSEALAVKHLIDLGHTEIVHFGGPDYSEHTEERIAGVRKAFSESRLIFDPDGIIPTGDSVESGYRVGKAYFSSEKSRRVTGVTCYNDLVAIGLLKALTELDIRVPEDVSVIGFDNLSILDYFPQPLTTINVPKYEMGRRAAQLLIGEIEDRSKSRIERVYLEAELIIRGSTAPPSERA